MNILIPLENRRILGFYHAYVEEEDSGINVLSFFPVVTQQLLLEVICICQAGSVYHAIKGGAFVHLYKEIFQGTHAYQESDKYIRNRSSGFT